MDVVRIKAATATTELSGGEAQGGWQLFIPYGLLFREEPYSYYYYASSVEWRIIRDLTMLFFYFVGCYLFFNIMCIIATRRPYLIDVFVGAAAADDDDGEAIGYRG